MKQQYGDDEDDNVGLGAVIKLTNSRIHCLYVQGERERERAMEHQRVMLAQTNAHRAMDSCNRVVSARDATSMNVRRKHKVQRPLLLLLLLQLLLMLLVAVNGNSSLMINKAY